MLHEKLRLQDAKSTCELIDHASQLQSIKRQCTGGKFSRESLHEGNGVPRRMISNVDVAVEIEHGHVDVPECQLRKLNLLGYIWAIRIVPAGYL